MDVLERVPDIHAADAPVSEAQMRTARQTLLRQIAHEERRVHSSGRRRWAGVSLAVGGVAVTAIAISVLVPPRVDSAAAAVLEAAADVTINAFDTEIAPGQYLRIQTDNATLWKWDVDMGMSDVRFNNSDRADAEAGLVVNETRVLYVPADRSEDWIWDWSADQRVVEAFGARSSEAVADWTAFQEGSQSGYWPDLQRLPGGQMPSAEGDTHEYLLDSYRRSYDEMPRDPAQLLAWYRESSGDPEVSDQWVIDAMTGTLSANLMPADLRAATLRAMALVPGIKVGDTDGDLTTLVYESGAGGSSRTTSIVVDTTEGMITSVAETFGGDDGGVIPNTTPDSRRTVTTTVVDTAPQP